EKKWTLIYNDAYLRWKNAREKLTHRPVEARSAPANESPEWYIGRFMNGSITQQQVASLGVCLRTYELKWLQTFIALKGQAVLGNALHNINKADNSDRKPDTAMEAEIIKCLRQLFNHEDGARDALDNNTSISPITASLASEIPTRKSVIELLTFFVMRDRIRGFNLVLKGLDDFSSSRRLPGKFDGWFFFWEAAIDGRGRFGSAVGASDAI
ncbi:uncharacterized protein RHOBADRAFT_7544, partial [Rhodotorula graminis WP1]